MSYLVQPAGQGRVLAERSRFLGQDDEYGLEGIFCILIVVQDPHANCENERPMAFDDRTERSLIILSGIRAEQFAIALALRSLHRHQSSNSGNGPFQGFTRHGYDVSKE
jgi:hypothetical protein